ncbi:hypothetical protein AYO41_02365 [Verrucomicrobia bacterium SCGC AG-212-E04]|nr:hypothetical protein AYO41_02365 [Verrucomicrobia bacterium SCGC AG-212-E04]
MSAAPGNPSDGSDAPPAGRGRRLAGFFGLQRNLVLLLVAIVLIGSGEELWIRFVPKYLETLGAGVLLIGLYDGLKTLLGAVYAYPGGVLADRWGHRRALLAFTALSIAGYALVALVPHPVAVFIGMFLFLAWSCLSLPATFSLVGSSLGATQHSMGIGVQSVIRRLPIIIGPVVGGVLIDRFGVVAGVRLGLLISIVAGVAALCVQHRIRETAPAGAASPTVGFSAAVRGFQPALRRLLLSDILIRFCERLPFAWVIIYVMDNLGASAAQAGLLTAVEMIFSIACLLPAAHLADRYGREPFVLGTFVFFTLFPLALWASHGLVMLTVAFALRGLKEFGEPARKALILGLCAVETRGEQIGAYYLIRDLVVTAGSLFGALLWKFGGPSANFLTASAIGAVATLSYAATLRRMRT